MRDIYECAEQIQRNIKFSSDNADFNECYWLCANKQHIEDLKTKNHQVIWGRRGTGKTTLQKAFVYEINAIQGKPDEVAFYVMMARMIPTDEEISMVTDNSALALYVFMKLIHELQSQIAQQFDFRNSTMEHEQEEKFLRAYLDLNESLSLYQAGIQGGEVSIDNSDTTETKREAGTDIAVKSSGSLNILRAALELIRKNSKTQSTKQSMSIKGKISFKIETQKIEEYIRTMLESLGISLAYICLDEYSEIDKVSTHSIQSNVAQLIKQVFFKNILFSVKIATIWNNSKLHMRGGNRLSGIEYKQDIFPGPDLDTMFMSSNTEVVSYFKSVLVNTYCMDNEYDHAERQALADYIETFIFGKTGLRHLICGSQGVSRSFVILVKTYLQQFLQERNHVVKLGKVYEMIKQQYMEDVRNKIPYFSVYRVINEYVAKTLRRYFLIKREDYDRCKDLIKYLAARGVYTQLPGHSTNREIRDDYKLFVIHYGNYLDAIESDGYKKGRKKLEEDAKLEANGMLLPDYDSAMLENPKEYTVKLPTDAEKESYCTKCRRIVITDASDDPKCPECGRAIIGFSAFIDENTF